MGYITQAVVVNLAPLMFAIFQDIYGVSYEMLARIVLINFMIQISADLISIRLAKSFSMRALCTAANVLCAVGMVLFSVLPSVFSNGYYGVLVATVVYAFGGGMIEVVVNPVVDACDNEEGGGKSPAAIALLHSFYCWGHVVVVLVSTLFIRFSGAEMWYILPLLWAVIPAINIVIFLSAKMPDTENEDKKVSLKELFSAKLFIISAILMITAGASEQAIAQWSSIFAEKGLGISKTMGDLLGTMSFAVCMAIVRIYVGLRGEKINTARFLTGSSLLCIVSYLIMVFVKIPIVSLVGCALCGVSVAFMWPGVLSLCAKEIRGGAAMFGILAFCGDMGCSLGPWFAGIVSDAAVDGYEKLSQIHVFLNLDANQIGLKCGILAAIIFPIAMFLSLLWFEKSKKSGK